MRKSSKILVTGGAGFIGSHLVAKLAEQGNYVRVLDNLSTGKLSNIDALLKDGLVDFVKGDIRDVSAVKAAVSGVDVVFHLAAQISVPLSILNPKLNHEVNAGGTSNLLNASKCDGVGRFVFVSSCAVYGEPVYLPIDEAHPTNPISPYAESKLISEQECLRRSREHEIESVVVRFFNVYGPKQGLNDYSGVIVKFIEKINQELPLTIFGDGQQTRDFVFVQDIADALLLASQNNGVNGQIFNIGTGKATTIKSLAETLLQVTNSKVKLQFVPERSGDIKHSYANISKASELLGYKPEFSLAEGLKALLDENALLISKK
jgi:UDP-glucose 4-epimerase